MIDYFALALGHGLIAIALLRLVLRDGLDADPLIADIEAETADNRKAASTAGRNAARRARGAEDGGSENVAADADSHAQAAQRPRRASHAQAAQRSRRASRAQAAKR